MTHRLFHKITTSAVWYAPNLPGINLIRNSVHRISCFKLIKPWYLQIFPSRNPAGRDPDRPRRFREWRGALGECHRRVWPAGSSAAGAAILPSSSSIRDADRQDAGVRQSSGRGQRRANRFGAELGATTGRSQNYRVFIWKRKYRRPRIVLGDGYRNWDINFNSRN